MIVYESVSAYLLPVAPCTLYSTVSLIKLLGLVLNKEMWITKTISVPPLELKVAPSGFYDLAEIKGALSGLTTLPLKSENFDPNKREFYDALSLRYRWTPKHLPSTCPCGKRFDVDLAVSCMKGLD